MKIFTFKIIQLSSPPVSGGSAQLDLDNSAMTMPGYIFISKSIKGITQLRKFNKCQLSFDIDD